MSTVDTSAGCYLNQQAGSREENCLELPRPGLLFLDSRRSPLVRSIHSSEQQSPLISSRFGTRRGSAGAGENSCVWRGRQRERGNALLPRLTA